MNHSAGTRYEEQRDNLHYLNEGRPSSPVAPQRPHPNRTPMTKINEKRTRSFQRKPVQELKKIAEAGSLGSAAAAYELQRRGTGAGAVSDEDEDSE